MWSKYRNHLPQLAGDLFLTDGGIETTLIFHDGFELPSFAAFTLLNQWEGRKALNNYFRTYAALAKKYGVGFILESATWRSSPDWGNLLGYSTNSLADANRDAIDLLVAVRDEFEGEQTPMVISGCVGPRGDGYSPSEMMTVAEAEAYHATQISTFTETAADMVTAITMTYVEEAIGLTRAAQAAGMPVVISFTVETNGRLPSGQSLQSAVEQVDAATDNGPVYYMINCAHPTHFDHILPASAPWLDRIRGLRANASTLSHAELDEAEELDDGNPIELGRHYRFVKNRLTQLNVLGGCCGTDQRHVEEICKAFVAQLA